MATGVTSRSTATTVILLVATVALGLASRAFASALPVIVARYAGDVLWASMIFLLLALFRPNSDTIRLAVVALVISVSVELSQLYHATWIDAIRASWIGAHLLGQGFLASDLVCYAAGVALAALVDRVRIRAT